MNGTVTVQGNAYEMCTHSRCLLTLTERQSIKILCQRKQNKVYPQQSMLGQSIC